MKKFLAILATVLLIGGCRQEKNVVAVETSAGVIRLRLYDETPLHRDNFMKLVQDKYYENMLFHRVIPGFVIQTGDPDSRNARSQMVLGANDIGYKIDAEIRPGLIHRRGVVAAAREGDDVNPERRSSGSHFYIVQGKVYRPGELDSLVERTNDRRRQRLFDKVKKEHEAEIRKLEAAKDYEGLMELNREISEQAGRLWLLPGEKMVLTDEQKKVYTTEGGIPFLDGAYTVFGEVVSGMEVVDKIAGTATDENDRPKEDVVILKVGLSKK